MNLNGLLQRFLVFGNQAYSLLGDAGFTLSAQLITPYVRQGGVDPTAQERDFNRKLSSVRIMIENGILGRSKSIYSGVY